MHAVRCSKDVPELRKKTKKPSSFRRSTPIVIVIYSRWHARLSRRETFLHRRLRSCEDSRKQLASKAQFKAHYANRVCHTTRHNEYRISTVQVNSFKDQATSRIFQLSMYEDLLPRLRYMSFGDLLGTRRNE
jgi:hypothetical protein